MRNMTYWMRVPLCAALVFAFAGCPGQGGKVASLFGASIRLGEAPLTVTFQDASALADPGGKPIETWAWDFGDGTTSTEPTPTHTYTEPGTYTVSLTTTRTQRRKEIESTTTIANFITALPVERTEGETAGEEATFDGIEFVWAPAGTFTMGAPANDAANNYVDAMPQHEVTISRGFWISKYEITQAQYFAVTDENDSFFRLPDVANSPDLPGDSISLDDAQYFVSLLNAMTEGDGVYRIPTEAEWEYACRAGTTTNFHFGDEPYGEGDINEYGWTNFSSENQTNFVGQLMPNDWGLYDMHGNVWEWTQDRYAADYYANSPAVDPFGPVVGSYHVARGGSWYNQEFLAASVSRFSFIQGAKYNFVGFRLIRQ